MPNNNLDNKRIAKNTMLLYTRMFITMAVSLYTSRVVLNILGVQDFGIYNIVGGIIVLFSFINGALLTSTQRFLNYEIGKNNIESQKIIFSSSMTIYLIFSIIVVILAETVGLWFLNNKLNIPQNRFTAANWVYQFSLLTFCFNILRVPYNAVVIAHEKMSFYAYLSIVEVVLKLLLVYLLVIANLDKLALYSFLIYLVSLIVFITYVIYCRNFFLICKYNYSSDKKTYSSLLQFSGWSLFGSLANVTVSQGINIIFNIYFGVGVNASIGITNQVKNAVNSFLTNFQVAFNPQIVKSYAAEEKDRFISLIIYTSKYSFYLMYIITLPFLLNTSFIIQKWLDIVPIYVVPFCQLNLLNILIDSLSAPLGIGVQATGQIKVYQILYSSLTLLSLPCALVLSYLGKSPVFILFIWLLLNFLIYLWKFFFTIKVLKLPFVIYLRSVLMRIFLVLCSLPIVLLLISCLNLTNWFGVIFSIVISVFVSVTAILLVGFDNIERSMAIRFIKNKIIKIKS